jgi:nitroreductase
MLHRLIVERRSPRAFDAHAVLSEDEVDQLLEAAGLAPSAMNRQPWAFLVGHRGDRVFKGIADALSGRNQLWAPAASVLLVAMVDNGKPEAPTDPGRAYELGLAMGQLGVQAVAMGLITHQMGGFDARQVREEFDLPQTLRPMVVVAVGYPGEVADLPAGLQDLEGAPRVRRDVEALRVLPNAG